MANGKKLGWIPADEEQEEKAEGGEVYQGQDGNFYQHQDMAKASPKNPPAPAPEPAKVPEPPKPAPASSGPSAAAPPTASGMPSGADLDAAAKGEAAKNATMAKTAVQLEPPASFQKPAPQDKAPDLGYDADKMDSTGKNKKDGTTVGPRGQDAPPDTLSEAERAARAVKGAAKKIGESVTHLIDSRGQKKGSFAVEPQGVDKNGAKIPDKVDYEAPTGKFQPVHGPRGKGAPKDTFHGR